MTDIRNKPRTIFCRDGWYFLGVLLFLFFCAMAREAYLMLLLPTMMMGMLILSWRMAIVHMRQLKVKRRMPGAIGADDPWVVQIEIDNQSRRLARWAIVVEQTVRRIDGDTPANSAVKLLGAKAESWKPAVYFPFIPARQSRTRSLQGRIPQRGRYEVSPLIVSTRFPIGLFRRELEVGETEQLTVYPHIGRLSPAWITRQHDAADTNQRRQPRQSRGSGDLFGVRHWQSGDHRRWIHWRATARHGDLVVRQFEQPRSRDAAVLLDLWQPGKPSLRERENVELAVSLAATLVHEIYRRGGANMIVGTSNGEPTLDAGPVSSPLTERIMDHLAMVQASPEDHLPKLLEETLTQIEGGAEIIIVSTRPVELDDRGRFAKLHENPAFRAWVSKVRILDTSDKQIEQVYVP